MTYKIILKPADITIEVQKDTPLIDVLHEYGVEFPCGSKGTCGGCKVRLVEGNIEVDDIHKKSLEKLKLDPDWRLSCMSKVTSDITLEVFQYENIILTDNSSFEFQPRNGYGIAVDIGTTTIVAQMIELTTGKVMGVETNKNPQGKHGADIMSRIFYATKDEGNGMFELQSEIRTEVYRMISKFIDKYGVIIEKLVLVGNTVMHNLFCGIDVAPLSMYPFHSNDSSLKSFSASDLGWEGLNIEEIIFLPSLGSFVGSDILAGIIASKMHTAEKPLALIDLGTNGEIAIGNKEGITVASTAAGPAFEGANISMGMSASFGAISTVKVMPNNRLTAHVLGNVKPRGICGSGLVDAISCLLDTSQLDMTGGLANGSEKVYIAQGVSLTQKDIREFQLAKAAISAGVRILLNKKGLDYKDLDKILIAGGFGNFIDLDNLTRLGILECNKSKIDRFGNSSLLGAKMALYLGNDYYQKNILNITTHFSLESDLKFQDIYTDKMFFGNL